MTVEYVICSACEGKGYLQIRRVNKKKSFFKRCKYCGGNGYNYKKWQTTCLECGKQLCFKKGEEKYTNLFCYNCWRKLQIKIAQDQQKETHRLVYCKECGRLIRINVFCQPVPIFCSRCWQKIRNEKKA